jgi:hypothetical protein
MLQPFVPCSKTWHPGGPRAIKLIGYMTFCYGTVSRALASIRGRGIWLMRGAWGSGVLGRTTQTLGNLASGYIYEHDASLL